MLRNSSYSSLLYTCAVEHSVSTVNLTVILRTEETRTSGLPATLVRLLVAHWTLSSWLLKNPMTAATCMYWSWVFHCLYSTLNHIPMLVSLYSILQSSKGFTASVQSNDDWRITKKWWTSEPLKVVNLTIWLQVWVEFQNVIWEGRGLSVSDFWQQPKKK